MRLYLAQHGDALPEQVDPDRPLSAQGRADVERIAALFAEKIAVPARVLHSGKTRARESAEILARRLAPAAPIEVIAGINPKDDPEPLAAQLDAWVEDVLLVGHMPFMGRLASLLLGAGAPALAFSPGTLVCLERQERGWALAWMVRPELLTQ